MKQFGVAALALLGALLISSRAPAGELPLRADSTVVAKGNTAFALELYGKLRAKEGNLLCSPFSISTALAMTSAGARRRTLEQMASTLHLPEQKRLHPGLGALIREVNGGGKKGGYQVRTANALWGKKGAPFLASFLDINKANYGAGLRELDFFADPEGARRTINAWVEKETKEKIKDLLAKGMVKSSTRLVLTNAIYFKGDWASQFKKDRTREGDFRLADGKTVKAPLMHQTERLGYLEQPTFQAMEMPYVGKDLSMVVLLPRKANGLPDLEKTLTPANLATWFKGLRTDEVEVTLPRFKMTSSFDLIPPLLELGMHDAFNSHADFSGIDGSAGLYISAVVHKAFVDVNEQGGEAAAATGVVTDNSPRIVPVFRADRPFVFLIRDRRSDTVLFMGRLADPR